MPNIFKSKEIYKKLTNVSPNQNPLRAVRGMYVSGTHREPYYIDAALNITDINTTPVTVTNYGLSVVDPTADPCLNIYKMEFDTPIVTYYTKAYSDSVDPCLNIYKMEFGAPTITYYIRAYSDPVDPCLNIYKMKFDAPVIELYSNKVVNNTEPMIHINSITTTVASVNVVTP